MAKGTKASLNESIAGALKGTFNLDNFKEAKNLSSTSVKMKEQKWIPLSQAFQDCLSIPGIPKGHITLLRGHSDTGKTTALLEAAVSAQKMGVLPVFIVTEMKWNWEHAKQMGLQFEEVADEDGVVKDYKGFFLYVDREKLNAIEDVGAFIGDLLDEQKNGRLPYDLLFLWDSVGSIPSQQSIDSNKNNNEWNAGAMSKTFGNFINQRIVLSRKESSPYTNTMVAINKIWVAPAETIMSQPKMKMKNGETMFLDSTIVLTFGNITNSGTSKIKATKNGKEVEFAKRSKVSCDKNHVTGITTKGTITMTVHGFIPDEKSAVDNYKKEHSNEWAQILGSAEFDLVEDNTDWEENVKDIPLLEDEQ